MVEYTTQKTKLISLSFPCHSKLIQPSKGQTYIFYGLTRRSVSVSKYCLQYVRGRSKKVGIILQKNERKKKKKKRSQEDVSCGGCQILLRFEAETLS